MMENGMMKYIESTREQVVKQTLCELNKSDEVQLFAFTLEQLKRPMMLIIALWISSVFVLIAEIMIFNWISWRNRK